MGTTLRELILCSNRIDAQSIFYDVTARVTCLKQLHFNSDNRNVVARVPFGHVKPKNGLANKLQNRISLRLPNDQTEQRT